MATNNIIKGNDFLDLFANQIESQPMFYFSQWCVLLIGRKMEKIKNK